MSRRVRRVSRINRKAVLIILCMILLSVAAVFLYFVLKDAADKAEKVYMNRIDELESRIDSANRRVFVAKDYIAAGTILKADIVEERILLSDSKVFATEADIGKVFLTDVLKGSEITRQALSNEKNGEDIREIELDFIKLPLNISEGDYADIRLRFSDGTDFIVVSKKRISGLERQKNILTCLLNEEELLLLNSAMVDTYLYNGAQCYLTRYADPTEDAASVVNYIPSERLCELIKNDPNIVKTESGYLLIEERLKLEEALKEYHGYEKNEPVGKGTDEKQKHGGSVWD